MEIEKRSFIKNQLINNMSLTLSRYVIEKKIESYVNTIYIDKLEIVDFGVFVYKKVKVLEGKCKAFLVLRINDNLLLRLYGILCNLEDYNQKSPEKLEKLIFEIVELNETFIINKILNSEKNTSLFKKIIRFLKKLVANVSRPISHRLLYF